MGVDGKKWVGLKKSKFSEAKVELAHSGDVEAVQEDVRVGWRG